MLGSFQKSKVLEASCKGEHFLVAVEEKKLWSKAHFFTTTVFFRYAPFESTNIPQKILEESTTDE